MHAPRKETALTDANQLEYFFDEGLIEAVLRPIKSGKEASVHLCRANPSTTGEELAALKTYHPLDRRDFRDESMYRDGEWIKERRVRVALEQKTKFGREVQGMLWVDREWETLGLLSAGAAPVPRPIARTGDAILMTYMGDGDVAAPQLRSYPLDGAEEAEAIVDQVLRAVERMLFLDVVHGDLSPYNLLVWDGAVTVIDLPQAVDPKKNRHAKAFLERDVERICDWAERHGIQREAGGIAADLWTGWELADLVPEELRGLTM
jgi:RIO kinase 1